MRAEEDFREWLRKANEDFGFASSVLPDTTFYAQVCFHFQQSAEKHLKAYLVANGIGFRRTHDLSALLENCKEKDAKFGSLFEDCNFLTDYAVDIRYPVHWPSLVTKDEALKAQESARKIKEFVERLIS